MRYEMKPIDCFCEIDRKSIFPLPKETYTIFSFPAFDNNKTPEICKGDTIKSSKFLVKPNTILFNKLNVHFRRVWNIGEVVPENGICSTEFIPLKPKQNICKDYLYYNLIGDDVSLSMYNARRGTSNSQQRIAPNTLLSFEIPCPPLEKQFKIASILKALDDKIENNTKINHHLEQMAQAIFKSWFVDFEPFGGVMPDGWRKGILSEIANITMGQSPDGKSYNEDGIGTIFYQGRAEFGFRFPTRHLFTTQPKRMAAKGDVLTSVRAPVGDLNVAFEPCCLGRGLAGIQSNSGCQSFILYTMFALKRQLDMFNSEGTVFGSINKNDMANLPVLIPSDEVIYQFEELVSPMDAAIEANYAEGCNLQAMRDALLPRLMSGELSVDSLTAK